MHPRFLPLLLLWFSGPAMAQDEDRPLAIPVDDTHPPMPTEPGGPSPTPPPPASELPAPDKTGAMRAYRDRHLAVRTWAQLHAVYNHQYSEVGVGYGGVWGGWNIMQPTIISEDRWGVYQGPQRLDNLDYLMVVGARQDRQRVSQQITSKRRLATAFNSAALAGGVATVIGLLGMDNAQTVPTHTQYQAVGTVGIGVLFTGAIGGAFPSGKARRLQYEPTEIRTLGAYQEEIEGHNARLARELELTPEEALAVEQGLSQ